MKTFIYSLILLLFVLSQIGCSPRLLNKSYDKTSIQQLYTAGVKDASQPTEAKIYDHLSPITDSNSKLIWKEIKGEQYVLVASWKADTKYYKNDPETGFYNTGKYEVWVTAVPQLKQLCQTAKFGKKEGVNLRLKQLLGLPPDDNKQYFVEFWVRPKDLFRPCPDAMISDEKCDLEFPKDATKEHIEWTDNLRAKSYSNPQWDKNYPWTQLGYTYDWNASISNHVGLSEYVISTNAEIVVKGFYATADYCNCKTDAN